MTDQQVTVTTKDHATGESETQVLPRDSYILVCGEDCYVSYHQFFSKSGTHQVTIKKGRPE